MEFFPRNVNAALYRLTSHVLHHPDGLEHRAARGVATVEFPEPVLTHYAAPRERVLFSAARDANPFLHFFESLWMLGGRDDVTFARFIGPRLATYADDGLHLQGAYGFRWRRAFGGDQLQALIAHLRRNPESRRAVLAMWDPRRDLWAPAPTEPGEVAVGGVDNSKDVPCNTAVYFKVRAGRLAMTVTNRSNDAIWGAYGANAVHMSVLQEYVANKLRLDVGPYAQISDSLHVYTEGPGAEVWARMKEDFLKRSHAFDCTGFRDPYASGEVCPYDLGAGAEEWDADLRGFFESFDAGRETEAMDFRTPFFRYVVWPLWEALCAYRAKEPEKARALAGMCEASDWRVAAVEWLDRRAAGKAAKHEGEGL